MAAAQTGQRRRRCRLGSRDGCVRTGHRSTNWAAVACGGSGGVHRGGGDRLGATTKSMAERATADCEGRLRRNGF